MYKVILHNGQKALRQEPEMEEPDGYFIYINDVMKMQRMLTKEALELCKEYNQHLTDCAKNIITIAPDFQDKLEVGQSVGDEEVSIKKICDFCGDIYDCGDYNARGACEEIRLFAYPVKWASELIECNSCSYKWTATFPSDLRSLECPNCSNMTIFNVIKCEESFKKPVTPIAIPKHPLLEQEGISMPKAVHDKLQEWINANIKLTQDYDDCVEKFDNCRACLSRTVEKLGLEVNPPNDTIWHTWLIQQLDSWQVLEQEKEEGLWISVKEPPEIGEYVLVNIGEDTVLKGRLMNNGWTAFFSDGENLVDDLRPVTHWQPLPKSPKKSKQ